MDAPEKIWLQRPCKDSMSEWCGEVTWCDSRQNDDDTEYTRSDAVERLLEQCDCSETEQLARAMVAGPELLALAERVARLNRDAGEIGAGMLASLVDEARFLVAKTNVA